MEEYNPDLDFALNARDHFAIAAPLPQFVLSPQFICKQFKIKEEDFNPMVHVPLSISLWKYTYANAMLEIRKCSLNSNSTPE